jgi:hypothetical protein
LSRGIRHAILPHTQRPDTLAVADRPSELSRYISISASMPSDKTLPEQGVQITGKLPHAISAHHHAKAEFSSVKIECEMP